MHTGGANWVASNKERSSDDESSNHWIIQAYRGCLQNTPAQINEINEDGGNELGPLVEAVQDLVRPVTSANIKIIWKLFITHWIWEPAGSWLLEAEPWQITTNSCNDIQRTDWQEDDVESWKESTHSSRGDWEEGCCYPGKGATGAGPVLWCESLDENSDGYLEMCFSQKVPTHKKHTLQCLFLRSIAACTLCSERISSCEENIIPKLLKIKNFCHPNYWFWVSQDWNCSLTQWQPCWCSTEHTRKKDRNIGNMLLMWESCKRSWRMKANSMWGPVLGGSKSCILWHISVHQWVFWMNFK